MPDWTSVKWLCWIGLYLILGILVPWIMTRAWAQQHGSQRRFTPSKLFEHGELGLFALVLAISVVWDVQNSSYSPQTIALGSTCLAMSGIMAATVWIESRCRESNAAAHNTTRSWRDSRNLAFLVFSIAAVAQILLDRLAQVMRP